MTLVKFQPRVKVIDTNPTVLKDRLRLPKSYGVGQVDFNNTLPIAVSRIYTTVDGTVIDKSLAPAALQTYMPVYLLSPYDMDGGYRIGQASRPPAAGCYYLFTFVFGTQLPFPFATGFNDIQNSLTPGDICQVYTDSLDSPAYYVYIVQTLRRAGTAGLASVIKNLYTKALQCKVVQLYANNIFQFDEPLKYITANPAGIYTLDDVNPNAYKDPLTQAQNGFIDILTEFEMNEFFGIDFYMQYATSVLSVNLKLKI